MMDAPLRTFTVGYGDYPKYNELEYAREVSREYGTDHHEVIIGQQDLIDFLPDLIFHQDEPIADPVCVPLYYVSELARQTGTKVVQVGEGSDELFFGYREYKAYLELDRRVWRHLIRLPVPVKKIMRLAGLGCFHAGARRLLPKGRKMVPDLLRRIVAAEELFWANAFIFDEVNKRDLLLPAAIERLKRANNGKEPSSYSVVRANLDHLLEVKPDADELERIIYGELKFRLAELLLMRVDKITMATSVEARVPFLDHKLVEFAMSIPASIKYRNRQTKYILKRALRGHVPDSVLDRRKTGFATPINEWMLDRLGGFLESSLFGSELRRRELFDYGFIKRLLSEHRSRVVNNSFFLWCLLNLSLWYDQWITGHSSPELTQSPTALNEVEASTVG